MKKTTLIFVVTLQLMLVVAALVFACLTYLLPQSSDDPFDQINAEPIEYLSGSEVSFTDVISDTYSNYAVATNGDVYAWGYNAMGVLGIGDTYNRHVPEPLTELKGKDIVKVSNAFGYGLALCSDGKIFGWGWKDRVLLGAPEIPASKPFELSLNLGEKIIDIAAGQDHATVITESGKIYTWGMGNYGNLGLGTTYYVAEKPEEIESFCDDDIVQIVSDIFTTVVVTEGGDVYIWGVQHFSQSYDIYLKEPTKVEGLNGIHVVQATIGRSMAFLTDEGQIYTWGQNQVGELGLGDKEPRETPAHVELLADETIVQVSSSANHMLAITEDNKVFAWGYNNRGQTASPVTYVLVDTFVTEPKQIDALSDKKIVKVLAGAEFSLAISGDGTIYAWGYGGYGQLGLDNVQDIIVDPTPLDMFVKKSVEI